VGHLRSGSCFGNCWAKPSRIRASAYNWELYDVTKDWTQYNDVAATNRDKLKEMQRLLGTELATYNLEVKFQCVFAGGQRLRPLPTHAFEVKQVPDEHQFALQQI
jgi:hypothetical protein